MKPLFSIIFLLLGLASFSQSETIVSLGKSNFKCDKAEYNPSQNEFIMEGNVSLITDLIELEEAEKVTYNKELNEIKAIGVKKFVFSGGRIEIIDTAEKKDYREKTLRYKIGESVVYLE